MAYIKDFSYRNWVYTIPSGKKSEAPFFIKILKKNVKQRVTRRYRYLELIRVVNTITLIYKIFLCQKNKKETNFNPCSAIELGSGEGELHNN